MAQDIRYYRNFVKKHWFSISSLIILFITSYVAIIQIIFLYINGFFVSIFNTVIPIKSIILFYIVNSIFLILFSRWFLISKKKIYRLLFGLGILFCINGLIGIFVEEYLIDTSYYELQFQYAAILSFIILFLLELFSPSPAKPPNQ